VKARRRWKRFYQPRVATLIAVKESILEMRVRIGNVGTPKPRDSAEKQRSSFAITVPSIGLFTRRRSSSVFP
jgi:hypothetical protein